MILVNKDIIKEFDPCEDGFENYLKHYPDFNGSLKEFLDLDEIPYDDKVWLATKLISKNQAVRWSILCSESVLHNFEKEFPEDKRVRDCLEYLKSIEDFENLTEKQILEIEKHKSAAWSAAWSAESAAWSAESAAWSAVRSAESAAESAAWSAVRSAGSAEKEQEMKNLEFLKSVL